MKDSYRDIIDHPHHVSRKRPQMSKLSRAAQFSPFSALSGYEEIISESARITMEQIELSEDEKSVLNEKLLTLQKNIENRPVVEIVHFVPDSRKSGGLYQTLSGVVMQLDTQRQVLVLAGGHEVQIDNIYSIQFEQKL